MGRSSLVLVLLLIVGCGPSGGGKSAGPINDATSNEAGSAMASSIESGVSGFNPPRGPASAFGVADGDLPPSCYTFDPPVWTDTDLDFFPDVQSTATVDCGLTGTAGDFTIAGTNVYLDLAPGVPDFNFTSSYDGNVLFVGTVDAGETDAFEGSADFYDTGSDTATEGAGVFAIQQARNTGVDVFDGAEALVYGTRETTGWSLSYTPDAVWDRGVEIIPGQVDVSGEWEVEVRAGDYHQRSGSSVTTLSPLRIMDAATCATHVVGGQIRASFSESDQTSMLDVTWLGCGIYDVAFTGPPASD